MFPEYVEKQLAREKESEHAVVEEKEILLPDPSLTPDKTQQLVPTERLRIQMKGQQ
jgi:hypothetical protein